MAEILLLGLNSRPTGVIALVDDCDVEELKKYRWSLQKDGNMRYARRCIGTTSVLMHRQIMKANRHDIIDHLNRNGLDNRKANLRFATRVQP